MNNIKLTVSDYYDDDPGQAWGVIFRHLIGLIVRVKHEAGTTEGEITQVWYDSKDGEMWLTLLDHDQDEFISIVGYAIEEVQYI